MWALGLFVGTMSVIPFSVEAAISDWQRGAAIQPFSTTDIGSDAAQQAMDSLKATGANYVTLIVPYYQANRQSTDMYPSWNTPTDSSLITAITYAHSIGLSVMLKPHLETDYIEWRGNIETPEADRSKWFTSYLAMLKHYGEIAQEYGVEDYCIGTELLRMASPDYNPDNTLQWKNMISEVRKIYSGKLTYSANWYGELDRIGFWSDLDYIGISAYYDLYHAANSSPDELKKSWDGWRTGVIEPNQKKYGKPIVFTELGYRSIEGAHRNPWDWSRAGTYSEADQAHAYQALFEYWNQYPWMKGVELWRWEINPPGPNTGDIEYTPQNKLALQVMRTYWDGTQPVPQPSSDPGPVSGTSWNASANITPAHSNAGEVVSITSIVQNTSGVNVESAVVDFEIYASSGERVYQKFFESQTFTAGEQKSYAVYWSGDEGTYVFKAGVFSENWSTNYYWGDSIATIPVGKFTPAPQPTVSLDIWWPNDESTVQGLQPFKAMLTDTDISTYKMYWQVDNGTLNEMENNATDYPHKESLVDLSGWTWKGVGPYLITFTARDMGGNVILSKTVNISITY